MADGKYVASGSDDQTSRLWNLTTFRPLSVLKSPGHPIRRVVFTHDSRALVVGGFARGIIVWNVPGGTQRFDFAGAMYPFALSPDSKILVTTELGSYALWKLSDASSIGVHKAHRVALESVFSPDGKMLATWSDDGTATIWRAPPTTK